MARGCFCVKKEASRVPGLTVQKHSSHIGCNLRIQNVTGLAESSILSSHCISCPHLRIAPLFGKAEGQGQHQKACYYLSGFDYLVFYLYDQMYCVGLFGAKSCFQQKLPVQVMELFTAP